MPESSLLAPPLALPTPILELCAHLEERGIPTLSHGEGLLEDLRTADREGLDRPTDPVPAPLRGTRSLLCAAESAAVLRALPRAVVTGEQARRITQSTAAGPVDLVFAGDARLEEALLNFGLGPLCFGFRLADASWCDPSNQRSAFLSGRLDMATHEPNIFSVAPRRYWIAARLMAEHGLLASPELIDAAQAAFPEIASRLPQAAPARRELTRILSAADPGPALGFLRESGVSGLLVPGARRENEAQIRELPQLPALRWAAWLRGSATASALVRFRVPRALARKIERMQASHPLERSVEVARDLGIRKLLGRHDMEEIAALLAWRRLELVALADTNAPSEAAEAELLLTSIEARIQEAREAEDRRGQVRVLALDGRGVMEALGAGPGRHVGMALAHLAHFVAEQPSANQRPLLEAELREWAKQNTNLLD